MNYIWLDVETTGLDQIKNDIIQIGCVVTINGEIKGTFNEYCQPINKDNIDDTALAINGITRSQIETFQSSKAMMGKFLDFMSKYDGKFVIAGYNVAFDRKFISAFFTKMGREKEFFNFFAPDIHDTHVRAKAIKKELNTQNLKLETLANHFGVEIKAHDAMSDILATIEVDKHISKIVGDEDVYVEDTVYKIPDRPFKEMAHLHCHSVYSFTDSVPHISEWIEWCDKNGVPGISIVDHWSGASLHEMSNIKGVIDKLKKDKKIDIKNKDIVAIPGFGVVVQLGDERFNLNAWATSNKGYYNLVKMASIGWENTIVDSEVTIPVVPFESLVDLKEDVVFGTSGVNGPFTKLLLAGNTFGAEERFDFLNEMLDLRIELVARDVQKYFDAGLGFRNYKIDGSNMQKTINQFLYEMHKTRNVKCVPTSEAHFLPKEDKIIQDCVCKNAFKDNRYFYESRHQLTTPEIYAVLNAHLGISFEEFDSMIENTYEIMLAAKNISIKTEYHLPKIDIPEHIAAKSDDYNMQTYYLTMEKIKQHGRWSDDPVYVERFKKEIDVVMKNAKLNFLPYFLVYEDICSYARSQGFLQNIARGSAGGSLLSYYLKIIHIDPIQTDLPFERFLSHARINAGSFPDIDLDLSKRARPLVMQYLKDKYNLGFAQIATFSKMKTKNAIKDAMWALYGKNRNDPEVVAVCDEIDDSPQGVDEHDFLYGYIDQEEEEHKGEIEKKEVLRNFFAAKPEIESMVQRLIGTIRGWSRHPSAFVISTLDLASCRIPTMKMTDSHIGDILVTQYDAPMVEKSGLVKADILGINTLNMVGDCVEMVKERYGVDLLEEDEKGVQLLYRLPEDKDVYADFFNKETDSSFQFNSNVIKGAVRKFIPLRREDLSLLTALYRPGSMDAMMKVGDREMSATDVYVSVRSAEMSPIYIHDDLKEYLADTHGVIVYQEQVMSVLVGLCGYSLEETDTIRSAIAKKKHEVIMATFDRIRKVTAERGWTLEQANALCDTIQAFSRYSFNKSHSRAYSELGYITMWLKHHYKNEWWCGVLNNEEDEDKIRFFTSKLADVIKPPSLKKPSNKFTIADDKIITPLSAIKGIGPSVARELVSKGPFKNLADYVERVNHSIVNVGSFSTLIKARAADDLMDTVRYKTYEEQRLGLMSDYQALRKSKTSFKDDMYDLSKKKLFMDERHLNQTFTKSMLEDAGMSAYLESICNIKPTGNKLLPYKLGNTPIIKDIRVANEILKKKPEMLEGREFLMILMIEGSEARGGISKKSGKPWKMVSSKLNDGYMTIEGVEWDKAKPYRLPENSLVFVRGTITEGWKGLAQFIIAKNGLEIIEEK